MTQTETKYTKNYTICDEYLFGFVELWKVNGKTKNTHASDLWKQLTE